MPWPSATFYRSDSGLSSTGTRHEIVAIVRACLADMIFKKVSILFSFQLRRRLILNSVGTEITGFYTNFCILRSIS